MHDAIHFHFDFITYMARFISFYVTGRVDQSLKPILPVILIVDKD